MSKKKSAPAKPKQTALPLNWNPDNFKYYFPVLMVVFLMAVLFLFRDFIFSDKMLYGSDMINAGVFFRSYLVDYVIGNGEVPAWNPYIFGGMPYVDAFHGDIFYPLSMLKYFGSIFRMLGLNLVIHIFFSGLFMYITARQFRLSRIASTLSAVGYMFSGLLVSLVSPGHDGKIFVITLFPLTILFLERAFEKKPLLNFTMLGLVIGFIILSPHPQLSYYSLWAIAFYTVFKLAFNFKESKSYKSIIKPSLLFVMAIVIGLLISAIQFYPGFIYTQNYSPRAESKSGYEWATSWSLHEEEAFSQIVPEFAGSNAGEGNYYWGKNAFKDNSEYAGVIAIFMALIGIFLSRKKEAVFFGSLALFAFIYALGATTPFFRIFYEIIPIVKSLRAPSTIMFLFVFSTCLCAGFGLQYIMDRKYELSDKRKKALNIILIAVPGLIGLFTILFAMAGESMLSIYASIFYGTAKTSLAGQNISKFDLALRNLPNIQTGFWIVFFLTGLTSAAIFGYIYRKAGVVLLLFIPLLAMIDGIRFSGRFIKTYDQQQQFSENALTQYFNNLEGKFRVLNFKTVPQDYLPYFGIEVVTGYHGNQLRWYEDLLGGMSMANLKNPNFLNLSNTKYILSPKGAESIFSNLGEKPVTVARDFGNFVVLKNDNAYSRAFIVDKYRIIPERKEMYPYIMESRDLAATVYLEEEPGINLDVPDSLISSAEIVDYFDDSIRVAVSTNKNSMLVLTDNYYHKWKAFVDGEEVAVQRAYGSYRAVPLKSGASEVVFVFDRSENRTAGYITWLTLLLVAVIIGGHFLIDMKNKKKAALAG